MSENPDRIEAEEPDIFSRGSLNLTYELLRKKDAELALTVRNISHETPVPRITGVGDNKNSDYFRVALDSHQVRAVVENLMMEDQSDPGRAVLAKVLVEDWMKLARKMIAELPGDLRPPLN